MGFTHINGTVTDRSYADGTEAGFVVADDGKRMGFKIYGDPLFRDGEYATLLKHDTDTVFMRNHNAGSGYAASPELLLKGFLGYVLLFFMAATVLLCITVYKGSPVILPIISGAIMIIVGYGWWYFGEGKFNREIKRALSTANPPKRAA